MLRRSKSSYAFIIFGSLTFYLGSLYLAARTSAPAESIACFSQHDNSIYSHPLSSYEEDNTWIMTDDRVRITMEEWDLKEPDANIEKENRLHPENTTAGRATEEEETYFPSLPQLTSPVQSKFANRNETINDDNNKRAKAAIVILCRNNELSALRRTLRQFEDRFNRKFSYPYVFLNDEEFTDDFKKSILTLTSAPISFGRVPDSMWSIPSFVNQSVMNASLADFEARDVLYGGSLSYRHMCRFNSGFFYRHPLLADYEYYWRVEPGVHFYCDLDYDPFIFMKKNNKLYSFTIALEEIPETIPTIWEHTLRFAHKHNLKTNLLRLFGDESGYNMCHFWSNFEIASLDLWRGERYQAYFDYLDRTGNFFYERWGDAIVHSLAAGLFLNKSEVHFFNDIGYKHDGFAHCIDDGDFGKCMCPDDVVNFDYHWGSCMPKWDEYPEEGYRWEFKPNGEQIFYNERRTKRPEFATTTGDNLLPKD